MRTFAYIGALGYHTNRYVRIYVQSFMISKKLIGFDFRSNIGCGFSLRIFAYIGGMNA